MFKPTRKDLENIFRYVGMVLVALGLSMFLALAVSAAAGEWSGALSFFFSACLTAGVGNILYFSLRSRRGVTWNQGLVIVALTWFFSMLFAALPLYLSGHYASYLDACFEAMSGLTTTGRTLVHDLDHMAYGVSFWRHFLHFMGGQGIVIMVLTYFVGGTGTAVQMYMGEARESIMPNVIESSRFIWKVSVTYLMTGTLALGICLLAEGMAPVRSFFQASCLFMAGFDTGGFAPQALNVGYYHSLPVELITVVFMVLGMTNFAVQYEVWRGRPGELVKNMELRVMFITMLLLAGLVLASLMRAEVFQSAGACLRRSVYHVVSAQSTTGFSTLPGQHIAHRWGDLALYIIAMAMLLGGCACSTAGGIKSFRIGIIWKETKLRLRKSLSPASSVMVERFHHIREVTMTDAMTRTVMHITLLFVLLFLLGMTVALLYGHDLHTAIFESASAGGNSGLTTGVIDYTMPAPLKLVFIFQMWAGRLELLAVVVTIAYFLSMLGRGRR